MNLDEAIKILDSSPKAKMDYEGMGGYIFCNSFNVLSLSNGTHTFPWLPKSSDHLRNWRITFRDCPVPQLTDNVNRASTEASHPKLPEAISSAVVESMIVGEYYSTAAELFSPALPGMNRLTICVLALKNGFTVTGESSCVSDSQFDAEMGQKIARRKAIDKVYAHEAYVLRSKMAGI